MKSWLLRRQLRKAGAARHEAVDLAALAGRLRTVAPTFDTTAKREIAAELGVARSGKLFAPRWALGGVFVAVLVIGLVGHAAGPDSVLYGLHRTEDKLAHYLHPNSDETEATPSERQPVDTSAPTMDGGKQVPENTSPAPTSTASPQPSNSSSSSKTVSPQAATPESAGTPGVNLQIGDGGSATGSIGVQADGSNGLNLQVQTPPVLHNLLNGL